MIPRPLRLLLKIRQPKRIRRNQSVVARMPRGRMPQIPWMIETRNAKHLAPMLAKHGLRLKQEVLDNPDIGLLDGITPASIRRTSTTAQLSHNLDDIEHRMKTRKA